MMEFLQLEKARLRSSLHQSINRCSQSSGKIQRTDVRFYYYY